MTNQCRHEPVLEDGVPFEETVHIRGYGGEGLIPLQTHRCRKCGMGFSTDEERARWGHPPRGVLH